MAISGRIYYVAAALEAAHDANEMCHIIKRGGSISKLHKLGESGEINRKRK